MSPLTTDDLHRIFKNLDKNNNGQVNIQELHHLLNRINIQTTLEELENFVGKTSLDYIDFFFFYDAMVKAKIPEHEDNDIDNADDLFKAFKVFDLNGDGFISCEELKSVLLRFDLLDKKSGGDCKEMIEVYDKNSDGVLDFEEFKNMMLRPTSSDVKRLD